MYLLSLLENEEFLIKNSNKMPHCIPIKQNEKDTGLSVPISPEDSLGEIIDRTVIILKESNIMYNEIMLDGDSSHPFQFWNNTDEFIIYCNEADPVNHLVVDRDTVKLNCQTTPGNTLFDAITAVYLI
jgi:hypothetical protein